MKISTYYDNERIYCDIPRQPEGPEENLRQTAVAHERQISYVLHGSTWSSVVALRSIGWFIVCKHIRSYRYWFLTVRSVIHADTHGYCWASDDRVEWFMHLLYIVNSRRLIL
jgi:hypothetical protein